jgi:ADP-ribose pyrophosphatase
MPPPARSLVIFIVIALFPTVTARLAYSDPGARIPYSSLGVFGMSHRETTIESNRLYSGRVVMLDVDRVRLPDGRESVREVVRHAGAVVVLPLFDDGRIVLVRQFRYPIEGVLLELPAGTLEPGEEPRACAERELVEETGWRAGRLRELGSFYSTPGFTNEVLHSFIATGMRPSDGGVAPEADEFIEVVVVSAEEALSMAWRGDIRDAKTLATLFLAQRHGMI